MTLFYTVLFSLGDPKQNLYCQMLSLQLASLRATKTLKEEDEFYIFIDQATAEHVRRTIQLPPNAKFLIHTSRPATISDGMLRRYRFPECLDVAGKLCVYLDLDMLSWRRADYKLDMIPDDTLLVYPEGQATDANYCGEQPLPLAAGLSSGYFIYRYGPKVQAIFRDTIRRTQAQKEVLYTIDQPHFNHAVAAGPRCCAFLNPATVSFNGNTNQATAAYLNCCGDPGDGSFHFQKMLEFFLRRFV